MRSATPPMAYVRRCHLSYIHARACARSAWRNMTLLHPCLHVSTHRPHPCHVLKTSPSGSVAPLPDQPLGKEVTALPRRQEGRCGCHPGPPAHSGGATWCPQRRPAPLSLMMLTSCHSATSVRRSRGRGSGQEVCHEAALTPC